MQQGAIKPAGNIETSAQVVNIQTGETTAVVSIAPIANQKDEDLVFGFFAIGIVINIVMITAYFIWAVKQWNNK